MEIIGLIFIGLVSLVFAYSFVKTWDKLDACMDKYLGEGK